METGSAGIDDSSACLTSGRLTTLGLAALATPALFEPWGLVAMGSVSSWRLVLLLLLAVGRIMRSRKLASGAACLDFGLSSWARTLLDELAVGLIIRDKKSPSGGPRLTAGLWRCCGVGARRLLKSVANLGAAGAREVLDARLRTEDFLLRDLSGGAGSCFAALEAVCATRCAGSFTGLVGDLGRGLTNPPMLLVPPAVVVVTDDVNDEIDARLSCGFCRAQRVGVFGLWPFVVGSVVPFVVRLELVGGRDDSVVACLVVACLAVP